MKLPPLVACLLTAIIGATLYWEADCRQHVQAARSLAEEDIGILVTTRPGWLPTVAYKQAYRAGVFQRPALAEIFVYISSDGEITIQGDTLDSDAAMARMLDLQTEITETAGTDNIHIMLVVDDLKVRGRHAAYHEMHRFANAEFGSSGNLTSPDVEARKKNLDPRNLMQRPGG